jgi:hypothetical protein
LCPRNCKGISACVNKTGGDKGYVDTDSGHAVDSAGHEFPHFAGATDRYSEGEDSAGNRVTTPDPGYEENSMGNLGKRLLNQEQMLEMRNNKTTKHCQGSSADLASIKCPK